MTSSFVSFHFIQFEDSVSLWIIHLLFIPKNMTYSAVINKQAGMQLRTFSFFFFFFFTSFNILKTAVWANVPENNNYLK